MKFIVDAQLPLRLKLWLISQGFDSIHTDDLAAEWNYEPQDEEISKIAFEENRIVISKDRDFLKLHILQGKLPRILLITTGNIKNNELITLFGKNFSTILTLFNSYNLVEMNNFFVVGHGE